MVSVPSLVWDEKYIRIINPNIAVKKCHTRNSPILHDHRRIMAAKQISDSYFQNGITAAKSESFSFSSQHKGHFLTHAAPLFMRFLIIYKAENKGPQHYTDILYEDIRLYLQKWIWEKKNILHR